MPATETGAMHQLLTWAVSKGAKVHKLAPQDRQFIVAEDVQAGDTLISIPQQLLLHAQVALNDAEYAPAFRQLVAELGPQVDDRHLLCLLLVLEKARQEGSAWEPYISILPEEYDDPYWWTEEQLQLVKGTRLGRAVTMHFPGLEHITASLNRLEQLHSAMQPHGSSLSVLRTYRDGWALQLSAARWARSAVWSRSFTVRMLSSGARNVVAMVPVLDMIDHSPCMEVVWHTGQDGSEPFQFVPLTAVLKGTVMGNNYGRKSSDELLLAYGFLLDGPNAADHLVVSLAHSRTPPASSQAGADAGDSWGSAAPNGRGGTAGGNVQYGAGPMSGADDGGDEDQAVQQQAAEDLQRSLAMASLNLAVDQTLGAADPLPAQLLLGAQLCLLPPSQLYLWTAQIQAALRTRVGTCNLGVLVPSGVDVEGMAADSVPSTPPSCGAAQQGPSGGQWLPGQRSGGSGQAGLSKLHEPIAGHKRSWNMAQEELRGSLASHITPVGDVEMSQGDEGGSANAHAARDAPAESSQQSAAAVAAAAADQSLSLLLAAASAMHIAPLTSPNRPPCVLPMSAQPSVHLVHQLQALVSMREQLQSRLQCMASDDLLQAAAQHMSSGSASYMAMGTHGGLQQQQQQLQAAGLQAPHTPPPNTDHAGSAAGITAPDHSSNNIIIRGMPHHSALALSYVKLQRALVHQSLNTLAQQVSMQVHAAAEPVAAAHQQHLIKWAPLGASPVTCLLPPRGDAAAAAAGAGPVAAWGSIDPDVHAQHYLAWLQSYGLLPNSAQAQSSMDVSPAVATGTGGDVSHSHSHDHEGSCMLREVIHTRAAPPRFLAQRSSSRDVMARASDGTTAGAGTGAAAGGSGQGRPSNGRVRGPPSSSRTFTMKGQQAAAQQPSSSGALPAGATTTPTAAGEGGSTKPGQTYTAAAAAKRVSLPQGLGASIGIDSDHDPIAPGVLVTQSVQQGQALMEVPLECCLCAPSKQQLVCSLMASAQQVLLSLLGAIKPHLAAQPGSGGGGPTLSTAAGMAGALVPLAQPHDMLIWHLMHSMAAPTSVRLNVSDVEGVQLLFEMLEDSPAGGAYQEAFDNLKNEFQQLRKSKSMPMGPASAPAPGTSKDHPMARLLSLGSSGCLYFWASHVVERCAMEVHKPWGSSSSHQPPAACSAAAAALASQVPSHAPAPGSSPSGQQQLQPTSSGDSQTSNCWVLAPVLSWIPGELRQAAMTAELQPGPSPLCYVHSETACTSSGANGSDMSEGDALDDTCCCQVNPPVFSPSAGRGLGSMVGQWSRGTLCVRAACDLHAGLHLSPLLLLPNQDMEELMLAWGPEALPWQQLLHRCIPRRSTAYGGVIPTHRTASIPLSPTATAAVRPNGSDAASVGSLPAGSLQVGQQAPQGQVEGQGGGAAQALPAQPTLTAGTAIFNERLSGPLHVAVPASEHAMVDANPAAASGQPMITWAPQQLPIMCQNSRTVLYELYICPGERDPLCHTKLLLLAAAGLGCVHYLTEDLVTEYLVMCALKICLADQSLLQHPLAKKCMQLHAAVRAEAASAGPQPTAADDAPLVPGGASAWHQQQQQLQLLPNGSSQALAGQVLSPQSGSATTASRNATHGKAGTLQQQLHDSQPALLAMLAGLPEEHPVCKASRKQLRQMVHDARKNTRRRLKQLEAVHNVVASHTTSSARGASYGVVSAFGGSYNPLGGGCALHEGVRLYLQGVCDVLDTWADHLGLNRQSDSMNKRHKSRPDD